MSGSDDTKILSGLLLVVVLLLLYFQYTEDNEQYYGCDGFVPAGTGYSGLTKSMYGSFRDKTPHRNNISLKEELSSLDFGSVNSMNDIALSRGKVQHMTDKRKALSMSTPTRWKTESFVAIDPLDQLSESNSNNSLLASGAVSIGNVDSNSYISDVDGVFKMQNTSGLTIPAEIMTPNKTCNVDRTAYNSVSGSQLNLMDFDYAPTYGSSYRNMDI
jgi:hypothetical protein